MHWTRAGMIIAALAASSTVGCPEDPFPEPIPTGCVTDVATGEHRFDCDDLRVDVSVPEACLDWPCGVILDVHGFTMDGDTQDLNTDLRALGRHYAYIVVQPTAPPGYMAETSWSPSDDERVLGALDDVVTAWHAASDRVHVTGFSQGGMMTWRMICHEAYRFASAAPISAAGVTVPGLDGCDVDHTLGCEFAGEEMPDIELPILYMHGHQDALVDFGCADAQREALVDVWDMGAGQEVSAGEGHTWTRYTSPNGTPFEFIEHDYLSPVSILDGHCFPGSDDHEVTLEDQLFGFACEDEDTFVWGEMVMDFFLHHPSPPADAS